MYFLFFCLIDFYISTYISIFWKNMKIIHIHTLLTKKLRNQYIFQMRSILNTSL